MSPEVFESVKRSVDDSDAAHIARHIESRRATTSVQRLIELMRERAVSEADFAALADDVDVLVARLEQLERSPRFDAVTGRLGDERWCAAFEYGPGGRSTVARPNLTRVLGDGLVTGEVTFGLANEGAVPGLVSGPWIAYVLDLASVAAGASNTGAVTKELTVRYRRPVPTVKPLTVRGRMVDTDGRNVMVSCEILDGDDVLIEGVATMFDPTAPRTETPRTESA